MSIQSFENFNMTPEEKILQILGKSHTTPCVFKNPTKDVSAIYTFKNEIFCLHDGRDFDFNDIDDRQKNKISDIIQNNEFIKNKAFQG